MTSYLTSADRREPSIKTARTDEIAEPPLGHDQLTRPTDEFSFVLKPSLIHGVGVFATHPIARGTSLRLFVHEEHIREMPTDHPRAEVLARHSIAMETHFVCAGDFGRMSIGWYLNHADAPNARHEDYEYYAAHDIAAGDEVTIDYETLW